MDVEDRIVDELLDKAFHEDAESLFDWFQSFSGSNAEQRLQAKQEIKDSLHDREVQRDPRKNFILRLLTDEPYSYRDNKNGVCKKRVNLAKVFLRIMKKTSDWDCFLDALSDVSVDTLLNTVSQINKQLLADWFECFNGSYDNQRQEAKQEILNTLRDGRQFDPQRNFIVKLMSNGYENRCAASESRTELAELILHVMRQNSFWEEFIELTRMISEEHNLPSAPLILRVQLSGKNLEHTAKRFHLNRRPPTLHECARLGDVETMRNLIEAGTTIGTDEDRCTPLHVVAVAIRPNAEVARLLVEALKTQRHLGMINATNNVGSGNNTAVHLAAANINVTPEFLKQLKDADPLMLNADHETPFHVAAKSTNSDSIVWMLETFASGNSRRWNADDVDDRINLHREERLINICARNGNAEAVALLIQHGSDISRGVLHEIVLESVRNPERVDNLKGVFRTIVDNAVAWRSLEEDRLCPLKSSARYREELKKTMIWLLTKPLSEYKNRDVLQCAISHGASAMLHEIVNTRGVFRHQFGEHYICFEITNFTAEMMSDDNIHKNSRKFSSRFNKLKPYKTGPKHTLVKDSVELHNLPNDIDRTNNRHQRNFDELHTPKDPYVTYLLSCYHRWKNTDILTQEPLKTLVKPSFAVVKRFYMIAGLLQLTFMVLFSVHYVPDTCSLSLMFNVSNVHCSKNNSEVTLSVLANLNNNNTVWNQVTATSMPTWMWLIWPAVLALSSVIGSHYSIKHAKATLKDVCENELDTKIASRFRYTFLARATCGTILQSIPLMFFCCSLFAWFHKYRYSDSYESYTEVTAMVLLFGWITNLKFFGSVSKNYSISALVVKEIILNDIPSYVLFFAFTVVGFSLAIHALRLSTCGLNEAVDLHDTLYGVLSSAFGIGDFFEGKTSDPSCTGSGTRHLFAAVYFAYVGVTMVILINVLIATMSSRYNAAKARAETVWRFRILSTMRALESHEVVVRMMRRYHFPDTWIPRTFAYRWKSFLVYLGCCCRSKHQREAIDYFMYDHRYFLRLEKLNDRDLVDRY